jgi:hypothetical protein
MKVRYSVIPALTLDGVLAVTVIQSAVDRPVYEEFLEQLMDRMQPYPLPHSVLIADNAQIHKGGDVNTMAEAR